MQALMQRGIKTKVSVEGLEPSTNGGQTKNVWLKGRPRKSASCNQCCIFDKTKKGVLLRVIHPRTVHNHNKQVIILTVNVYINS
jgi:hypothetical protein